MENRKSIIFYIAATVIVVLLSTLAVSKMSYPNSILMYTKVDFTTDMLNYNFELKASILKEKNLNKDIKEYLINEKDFNKIKKYIPSIEDKYKDVIEIKKGNIYYKGKDETFRKIATQTNAYISMQETLGEGTRKRSESTYKTPYIPIGFSYLEGNVQNGFVIVDDKLENEFVWIPVKNTGLKENSSQTGDYKKTDFKDIGKAIDIENTEDLTIEEVRKSIKKYGGFYIARYEAGEEIIDGQSYVVSKKNVTPYTNLKGQEAEILCANMYSNQNVGTMLMPGAAFDTTVNFILKNTGRSIEDFKHLVTDYGNFGHDVLKTGSSESYKMNNIYDLAGNVFEYTAEVDKATGKYLLRGGCVGYNPYKIDLTRRNVPVTGYENSTLIGFRPIMYIK